MPARVPFRSLVLAAALSAAALGPARADTPMPAHPPEPPVSVTAPPPPVIGAAVRGDNRASTTPDGRAVAPLPAASSAAATLGLKTATLPESLPAATGADPRSPEPKVDRLVAEDKLVRIEEQRVRSQTRRITVTNKNGMGTYELVPDDLSRPPSQDARAGKRVWFNIGF